MFEKIRRFILPSEVNNYKSKGLSLSSLSFYITILVVFQVGVNILSFVNPNILGYATNISIDEVLNLTNQKRAENGLGPLRLDPTLSQAAAGKAQDMFNNGYWAHISPGGATPWDFIVGSGYHYVYAGENLAKDFMDSRGTVEAWMASPTHRDNILNPKYQDVGLAVVNGKLNGIETTLVVQMFGTKQTAAAPGPVSGASEEKEEVAMAQPTPVEVAAAVTSAGGGGGSEGGSNSEVVVGEASSISKPVFNIFGMTKKFSLVVVLFLLLLIFVDIVVISQKRVRRLSGNSLFHFSFLLFILLAVLFTSAGTIL